MKKIICLFLITLFVFTSCTQEDGIIDSTLKSKKDKVTVCHKGKIITISGNALKAHIKHGDGVDLDGDGYYDKENTCSEGVDCDDANPNVNPGVEEICDNGIDDNCNGEVDEDCRTYVPDDNFEIALIYWGYDDVMDDYVLTSNISTVEYLSFGDPLGVEPWFPSLCGVIDFTGIEDFISLKGLAIEAHCIAILDLSHNINLTSLTIREIANPDFKSLDLSKNLALSRLNISETFIESFDLSNHIALTNVNLHFNHSLTAVNLKNGNNMAITSFTCDSANNLTCIQVDNAAYSTANWVNIDAGVIFSEDCGY